MGKLFVGRATEIEEFRRVLELARPDGQLKRNSADGPDEAHVVLIYGLGGIGKSTLLARLREVAIQDGGHQMLAADVLDCEWQTTSPGEHAGRLQRLSIRQVLDQLYLKILAGAADRPKLHKKAEAAFADFYTMTAAQSRMARRSAALGIGLQFGRRRPGPDDITALSALAGDAGQAVDAVVPGAGNLARPVASGLARSALETVAGRTKNQVSAQAYEALMADDLHRLVAAFARGLRDLSRQAAPLVVFIDTGELLDDDAIKFLLDAMRPSGQHVIWVIGLRMEDEASAWTMNSVAGAFGRSIGDTRLRRMPLRSFDNQSLHAYLDARLGPGHAGVDLDKVMRATHGIPLAVSITADLLATGVDPATALAPAHDGEVSTVVRQLADRYLVFAQKVPQLEDDLPLLRGLALLSGVVRDAAVIPGRPRAREAQPDPAALAALWDVEIENVAGLLDDLARRHDFVLTDGRRIHQEVREAVLLYLLDPVRRPVVKQMNERAAAHYHAQARARTHRTVDAQFLDDAWQSAMIGLLWHTFWVSLDSGVQLLCELSRAALSIDRTFAEALAQAAVFFAPVCPAPDRDVITAIAGLASFVYSTGDREKELDAIPAIISRATERVLAASPPASTYDALLLAKHAEEIGLPGPDEAELLLRAARDVPETGPTGQAIADAALNLGWGYKPPPEHKQLLVSALRLIAAYDPEDPSAHDMVGTHLFLAGLHEEAEAAFREALRLDPDDVDAHNGLGDALISQGRGSLCSYGLSIRADNARGPRTAGARFLIAAFRRRARRA
jgi:tetratricopeptide (TPR) repeat protein